MNRAFCSFVMKISRQRLGVRRSRRRPNLAFVSKNLSLIWVDFHPSGSEFIPARVDLACLSKEKRLSASALSKVFDRSNEHAHDIAMLLAAFARQGQ